MFETLQPSLPIKYGTNIWQGQLTWIFGSVFWRKKKPILLVFHPASFNTNEWLETEHFKECQGKKQLNWPS